MTSRCRRTPTESLSAPAGAGQQRAGVIAMVVALPPTRRMLRRRLEPLIKRTLPQLIAAATSPRRIVMALGGMLLMNGGYLLAIDASLRAFSASVSFPLLVVVYFWLPAPLGWVALVSLQRNGRV